MTIYLACISGIRDLHLRKSFEDLTATVAAAEILLQNALPSHSLHRLQLADFQMTPKSAAEVSEHIYKRGLTGRESARHFYDAIMSVSEDDICPLCGYGEVRTLDHHLPKSLFPALAVTVANLVPACSDCNKYKMNTAPTGEADHLIHPYFDVLDDHVWLHAELIENVPAMVTFRVQAPPHWDSLLEARVKNHLNVFQLPRRYSLQANRLISSLKLSVLDWNASGGASAVSKNLGDLGKSFHSAHPNGAQAAALRSLAKSEWFCTGNAYL